MAEQAGLLGEQDPATGLTVGGDLAALQPLLDWRNRNFESLSAGLAGASGDVPITSRAQAASLAPHLDLSNPLLMALGPGAIRGFHGTPYNFSAFSNEAIGTGEGAQAYGWGHYVAGNPKVAEEYREALSSGSQPQIEGKPLTNTSNPIIEEYLNRYGDIDNALANLKVDLPYARGNQQQYADALNWIESNKDKISFAPTEGSLLEVHIKPEEEELLDWDKPLSEQPQHQEALQSLTSVMPQSRWFTPEPESTLRPIRQQMVIDPNSTGQNIYSSLSRALGGDQAASQALHEAGIPGLKYLDAGSRNVPETKGNPVTRNYVIFDPSNLEIKTRNGVPLEPVDHNPFQGEQP